jgi:hypothetical protein
MTRTREIRLPLLRRGAGVESLAVLTHAGLGHEAVMRMTLMGELADEPFELIWDDGHVRGTERS